MGQGFDYVIVGGGTAGCVLAARLSEDRAARVCLIESGPRDTNPLIHLPIGYVKMRGGPPSWGLVTAPQHHADQRALPYVQARVLGGGSSINAQVFARGNPADYDRWASEGAKGWGFDQVWPGFLRAEGNLDITDEWHGTTGPLGVSSPRQANVLSRAFVQGCQEYGMPHNPDFNGAAQQGAGLYQTTARHGRRCSAAVGYLRPARGRPNLTVLTRATVLRIVVRGGKAHGVEYVPHKGRNPRVIPAAQEVIVTAGAIGSPKLMMLSGLGPADHLRQHAIDIRQDMPGVGQNLHDHYGVDLVAELTGWESLNRYRKPHLMLWAGLQYGLFRSGPIASNVIEAGAFWYADHDQPIPDLQFHFLAGAAAGAGPGIPSVPRKSAGITLNSYCLRPRSRGSVQLHSGDPRDGPLVDPNFLADPEDLRLTVEGIRISREILAQPALRKYIAQMRFPDDRLRSQADLEGYARRYGRTSYHPAGTCRMGQDQNAVVGPDLRVQGIDRLRICDSSVMPSPIGANTNATTIMIAERASDLIRQGA